MKLKEIILAILGIVFAWAVISFFTGNWDAQGLVPIILGVALGYSIKNKSEKKHEANG